MKFLGALLFAMQAVAMPATSKFSSPQLDSPLHEMCAATNSSLSCSSKQADSCCHEASFGLFMSTQLWDYKPAKGPEDKFTLHGTWSNKCDNGYDEFCQPDWFIDDPVRILKDTGNDALLQKMNRIWTNATGPNEDMWVHEFNKHGSCMSSLSPDCYPAEAKAKGQNAADFFKTSVELYEQLPTHGWLAKAGIVPSETATHKVADIQSVLSSNFGVNQVKIWCDAQNSLTQVMYFFHLQGSVATGNFHPIDSPELGNCSDGLTWKPKS